MGDICSTVIGAVVKEKIVTVAQGRYGDFFRIIVLVYIDNFLQMWNHVCCYVYGACDRLVG